MPGLDPRLQSHGVALLRAAARPSLGPPPLPDLTSASSDREALTEWLRLVWARDDVAGAVEHASPVLGRQVRALCTAVDPPPRDARRAVLAVARYLLRATGRATPFGWFAGVAVVSFAAEGTARWGERHQAVMRAGSPWLTTVIRRLESCPSLLDRLNVVTNSSAVVRGDRFVVPYHQHPNGAARAAELSFAYRAPLRLAVSAAAAPIRVAELVEKLVAEFPTVSVARVRAMVQDLVDRRALISALHAPATEPDALRYLLAVLDEAAAADVTAVADLVDTLNRVGAELAALQTTPDLSPQNCGDVTERMSAVSVDPDLQPLAVDLRLDATVTLPLQVADEVERAAWVLTRLSARPFGTPAWKAWHNQFYERYGIGTLVPVLEVVADSGIGFPDGYPGADGPERSQPGTIRDEELLALAQRAALDGVQEVVLDEALIARLELGPDEAGLPAHLRVGRRLPPHLEVGVRVHAADLAAMQRGRFAVEVVSMSRGAGVSSGRFLDVLGPADHAALANCFAALPAADEHTRVAQLSFPPLDPVTAHVTRTSQVLPLLISVAEHRPLGPGVVTPADLAVGCDGRRLYLAVPSLGVRVEAVGLHALNLDIHTPPLVRFLIELSRANTAQVTVFDWGAARTLPFLPAIRYGRTILSPARWRLDSSELPTRTRPWATWDNVFLSWRLRRRVPRLVFLADGDQRLPLDLDETSHRVLLREHLHRAPYTVLTPAPTSESSGWCGGRSHELIVPLTATQLTPWPRVPAPSLQRVVRPGDMHGPGRSPVLLAALYGDRRRQDTVLAAYLPTLLDRLEGRPWWYVRYRDPAHHLRLRVGLNDSDEFGTVAAIVAVWADELRAARLLRDLRFPTSVAETGRWGDGPAWHAAETVFRADSHALLSQVRQPGRPSRRALVTAHTVAIAAAFTGRVCDGMRWLAEHIPAAAPAPVTRPEFAEAVALADPGDDWAALRGRPGGVAIIDAWADRDHALRAYRTQFPSRHTVGVDVDDVLGSLLHVMFVRAVAIDFAEEAVCLYLARAAALAWLHRSGADR
jgi:thiopeptide-type bacteriocin biosynthesis protein